MGTSRINSRKSELKDFGKVAVGFAAVGALLGAFLSAAAAIGQIRAIGLSSAYALHRNWWICAPFVGAVCAAGVVSILYIGTAAASRLELATKKLLGEKASVLIFEAAPYVVAIAVLLVFLFAYLVQYMKKREILMRC